MISAPAVIQSALSPERAAKDLQVGIDDAGAAALSRQRKSSQCDDGGIAPGCRLFPATEFPARRSFAIPFGDALDDSRGPGRGKRVVCLFDSVLNDGTALAVYAENVWNNRMNPFLFAQQLQSEAICALFAALFLLHFPKKR